MMGLTFKRICVKTYEMATSEIDIYLSNLDEVRRTALESLREMILEVIPDAEQPSA